jgi:uncharacterized protein YjbI with pentapeptide repeats
MEGALIQNVDFTDCNLTAVSINPGQTKTSDLRGTILENVEAEKYGAVLSGWEGRLRIK